ncbi:MAG TPA: efflux RND transporter periplasmic adaptor subunit, partial [Terracidiphilus sp.]|nr:efflux RND transporter periplasmic adaptor subunit [Terracidiphilus sp.]
MTKSIALCVALPGILLAQAQTTAANRPAFEVASVKPHLPGPGPMSVTSSAENGRISYVNMTLKGCIRAVYGVQPYQISGGPAWVASERYDIAAKAAGRATADQMMPMLRALLEDRFKLKIHRESKELPIYLLVVAKNGPKIHEVKDNGEGAEIDSDDQHPITARNVSMTQLAGILSRGRQTDRPVFDQTGRKGVFNFTLRFAVDDPSGDTPDIFSALNLTNNYSLAPHTQRLSMREGNKMATKILEPPRLELLLKEPRPRPARRRWIVAAGAVALLAASAAAWRIAAAPAAPQYGTAKVRRQTVARTISATGTLQAVTTVQVGTEVSGTVSELHADFNSQVKKGQVIARLDPSQFQAQLAQANATWLSTQATVQSAQNNVTAADAGVQSAQANVDRTDAALKDAQVTFDRTRQLVALGAAPAMNLPDAQSTLDQAAAQKQQAIAQLDQAKAQAQAARSQVSQAQAQSAQAKAAVDLAQVNLDHTIVTAPIDGVVVARNVDVGQTVAASLQAPTVFLIANDLTRMQVLANIDEADVGQIAPDSKVSFTVDAYPNDVFPGRIAQVRLEPQTVQNVVTYTAVIDVANPALKLKPGMTANVTVVSSERDNVLTVPNSALRFQPPAPVPLALWRARPLAPAVWKVAAGKLTPVTVQTGLTDGVKTEVVSGDLKEGDAIAVPPPANG